MCDTPTLHLQFVQLMQRERTDRSPKRIDTGVKLSPPRFRPSARRREDSRRERPLTDHRACRPTTRLTGVVTILRAAGTSPTTPVWISPRPVGEFFERGRGGCSGGHIIPERIRFHMAHTSCPAAASRSCSVNSKIALMVGRQVGMTAATARKRTGLTLFAVGESVHPDAWCRPQRRDEDW